MTPERPVTVTASSELPDHPVQKAFDTFNNTDWQGNDKVPTITITFKAPIDLGALIIYSGNKDQFTDLRRPSQIALDFPDGTSTTLNLQDIATAQTLNFSASKVDKVTIRVLATNGPETAPISITEMEFFRKG